MSEDANEPSLTPQAEGRDIPSALLSPRIRVARWLKWLGVSAHKESLAIVRFRMSIALGFPISELSTDMLMPDEVNWIWGFYRASIEGYESVEDKA